MPEREVPFVELHTDVAVAYWAFARLRGSVADPDGLADEAAWACWRLQRLLGIRSLQPVPRASRVARMRACALALRVRWASAARRDIETAHLVVARIGDLAKAVERHGAGLTETAAREDLGRRGLELHAVLARAEEAVVRLNTQAEPLWQSFIHGASNPLPIHSQRSY